MRYYGGERKAKLERKQIIPNWLKQKLTLKVLNFP